MPRRILQGIVVSDKCDKTIIVRVVKHVQHPIYGKMVKKSSKYAAHDEKNCFKIGDCVKIRECSPISKTKAWEVIAADSN